jgi:SAM-dependent methyltransferase
MLEQARRRVKDLYGTVGGEVWDRIEDEAGEGFLERNVVDGRRRAATLLLRWMHPLSGRKVLDLGCGRGHLAERLAAAGASVTAADLLPRFDAHGRADKKNPSFVIEDGFSLMGKGFYDDIVIREVLEDYEPAEVLEALAQLESSDGRRVFLILRVPGPLSRLWRAFSPAGLDNTVDPMSLLSWIQQNTPFRLTRQETVSLRNYRVWVIRLDRASAELDTPLTY